MHARFKKNRLTTGLLLAGMLCSQPSFAADAASAFPDISQKNILIGFWHNWASKSDGYQQGTSADVALSKVPADYDVVTVAFMTGSGIPTFKPYNMTDAAFRAEIGKLNARGQAVLLSLGGADAHIELKAGEAQQLADEIIKLVERYGFDGLDIDLEGGAIAAGANQSEIPAALKIVKRTYPKFIISMAPEFPHLRTGGAYEKLINGLEGYYDFISPQYYNQGGDGVAAGDGWYAQNDDAKKADFLYYLTDSMIHGSRGFVQIPANKLAIGLPSNPDAAATGYAKKEADVRTAYEKLAAQGTPLKGLMTWSINWDAGQNKAGNAYGNEFVTRYAPLVHADTPGDIDSEAPSQPGKPTAQSTDKQVTLSWAASQDNVGVTQYILYRDGDELITTHLPQYVDHTVQPDSHYDYFVVAKDKQGNASVPSKTTAVTTAKGDAPETDKQKPSTPLALKSAEITQDRVTLSWQASTDNVAVKHYQVYRNGVQIKTTALTSFTDNGLKTATRYQYQIAAVDTSDNVSAKSQTLEVKTLEGGVTPPEYPDYKEGTAYNAGDIVHSKGSLYQCKPWPYTGWCAGAAWAYEPGAGQHWAQAWESYKG
ncbi:Chitinase D precursor [Serratia ficaria]|uniref:glycosyl hydrolase family 18 protein n=1 Tax=Serratia ficaria TaxID=61651 RepID=UPI002178F7C7|nr:glycosyl hydrolase family 18 protein [Serratia ficaria]CAI1708584.1 Chitinase D precursor [Serratia ficaria]